MEELYKDLLLVKAAVDETQRIVHQNATNYSDLLEWFVSRTKKVPVVTASTTTTPSSSSLSSNAPSSQVSKEPSSPAPSSSSSSSGARTPGAAVVNVSYVDQILRSARAVRTGKRVTTPSPKNTRPASSSSSRASSQSRRSARKDALSSSVSSSTASSAAAITSTKTNRKPLPPLRLPESFRKATASYRDRCGVILQLLQKQDEEELRCREADTIPSALQLRATFVEHLTIKPDLKQPLSALEESVVFDQLSTQLLGKGGISSATSSINNNSIRNSALRSAHEQYANHYLDALEEAASPSSISAPPTTTAFHTSHWAYDNDVASDGQDERWNEAITESQNDMAKRLHHRFVPLHSSDSKHAARKLQAFEEMRCDVAANLVNLDMARMCSRYLHSKYGEQASQVREDEMGMLWDYRLALVMLRDQKAALNYPTFVHR